MPEPPVYTSLDQLPPSQGEEQWNHLIEVLANHPKLGFLKRVQNYESGSMIAEESPYLVVVRVIDEYDRDTIGRNAAWKYDTNYGLRLLIYDDGTDTSKRMQEVDRAASVIMSVLRSAEFQTEHGFWYKADLPPRTVVFGNIGERCYATMRLKLFYRFKPGT